MTITIPSWVLYSIAGSGALVIVFWAFVGFMIHREFRRHKWSWS